MTGYQTSPALERYATYPSLRNKVVFITGGSSGIGADYVVQFAAQGAKVGFVGRNEAAAAEIIAACAAGGYPEPLFIACDLRDIEALRAAIKQTEAAFGVVTGLVNNAASDERHKTEDVTPEYWDDRLQVNLRHQFFAIQAVIPAMRSAGGGSIVNLGSIGWMLKVPDYPAYATSKAAVQGLTRTMAKQLGPDNIRVNCVVPGWIMTEKQQTMWLTPEGEKELLAGQCLKRKLYPPDVTRMILFLIADDSSGCTSQNYVVDGGWAGQ